MEDKMEEAHEECVPPLVVRPWEQKKEVSNFIRDVADCMAIIVSKLNQPLKKLLLLQAFLGPF